MKLLLLILVSLAVLVAVIAIVGALLPREHVATRAASFNRPPAELYAMARDFAAAPQWRSDVKSVELLPIRNGRACFRETTRHGAITFVVIEDRPSEKLITRIDDADLPFGGTWAFEFAAHGASGATLRITERGEVKNVIFRFLARYVFGHAKTMETYLRDLGRRLGEQKEPLP
jgi:hypothetical protein